MSENMNVETTEMTAMGGYALAAADAFGEASDDLAGLQLTFDRIRIPAGGSTAFEIPGDNDEMEMVKEIRGVILLHHPAYAYYRDKYQGGSNPPDCGSFDGVWGKGDPGGMCAGCPYNQFGSGEGQAKACKNRRMLYILMENEMFPLVLSLPTGSLKEFTKYLKRQLSRGRKLSQIVTKISLKKASSASGIAYSQAVFSFERALNPDEKAAVGQMVERVKEYAANLSFTALSENEQTPFDTPDIEGAAEPL